MLSDRDRERDRQTLREVQRRWLAEDPGFVASFDAVGPRDSTCSVQWAYDRPRSAYMTAMAVAVAVALVVAMLMLSAPGSALLFAALVVVTAVLWCHQDEDRQGA